MSLVLAQLCRSREEFLNEVYGDDRAQVRLAALSAARSPRPGEEREAYPIVRMVLTAAIPGSPPRWLGLTEDLDLDSAEGAQYVARAYAVELIARGLRPVSGEWSLEDVSRLPQDGGNGSVSADAGSAAPS
jgi:hypothetical protein